MTDGWRTVRVFISSTFRDMHAERDHLLRIRFPELAERLRGRRLHLVPVDLRWGVTEEQDALEICLEEIETCRPRFIGILGGRYGWVPPGRDSSITAAEITYGFLQHPELARYSFFYFRDPAATAAVPDDQAAEYREPSGSAGHQRLTALKHHILDALVRRAGRPDLIGDGALSPEHRVQALAAEDIPLPACRYPCRWDPERGFVDLESFGERVLEDLWATIEEEFPAGPVPIADPIGEEQEALDFFVHSRIRFFVGRTGPLQRIEQFVRGEDRPAVLSVVGAPGSGKSALLARVLTRLTAAGEDVVLAHFAGMSARSGSAYWILRRMVHELQSAIGDRGEVPADRVALQARLAELLARAASGRRVVVLIDALDQLDLEARYLTWLPAAFPPGVRVIVTLSEQADASLRFALRTRWEPIELRLGPLSREEAAQIVERALRDQRRTFTTEQTAALLSQPAAGNPLYLSVALGELAASSRFETLTDDIRGLPPDVPGLFQGLLQRLETDHDPMLVRGCCSGLAVARAGLTQPELLHLLQPAPGQPLAPLAWSRLRRALAPHLTERGELVDFFHRQLREAVVGRYLSDDAALRAAHGRLADTFSALGWTYQRTLVNLTAHLAAAQRDEDLIALMDGQFPDTKLAVLGSVAELASDYDVALEACARGHDLVHALRFTLNRSRLSLDSDWICQDGVAWAISRLAALQPGTEELRRAEAVVQDLATDPAQRARTWSDLASLLPAGDDRERLLLRAEQAIDAVASDAERDGARMALVRGLIAGPEPVPDRALRVALAIGTPDLRAKALGIVAVAEPGLGSHDLPPLRVELASRLWRGCRNLEAVEGVLARRLPSTAWATVAERDPALAIDLAHAGLGMVPSLPSLAVAALRTAVESRAPDRRACRRTALVAGWDPVARLLDPQERRALGVLMGRHGNRKQLARLKDPLVRRAAAQQLEPAKAVELLEPLLAGSLDEDRRATTEAAAWVGEPRFLSRTVTAWRSAATGATEHQWLRRFQRRRRRELLWMALAAAWLAPVFVGGLLGIARMFRSVPDQVRSSPLGGRIGVAFGVVVIGLLVSGFLWTLTLHGALDLLGRRRPQALSRMMGWLVPRRGGRASTQTRWRRWLGDPVVGLALLLDRVGNLGGPSGWPWTRRGRLAALAPHLKWLPAGPEAERLVLEAFEAAIRELRARSLPEVVAAAAIMVPDQVVALGRRACARLLEEEAKPLANHPSEQQRRTDTDAQWQVIAGSVASQDFAEGVGLLRQRLRPDSEQGRFGLRAGFVKAALAAAGPRGLTERVAFALLGWLREEPPSEVGQALWSLVDTASLVSVFPPEQVRAARAVAGTRYPVWLPVAAVAVGAFAGIVWLRYQLLVRWDWTLWTTQFMGGASWLPLDMVIEAAFFAYVLLVAGIVVVGGPALVWNLFRRLVRRLARPLVRGWLRGGMRPEPGGHVRGHQANP